MSSGKWWSFCLSLNVLSWYGIIQNQNKMGDNMFNFVIGTATVDGLTYFPSKSNKSKLQAGNMVKLSFGAFLKLYHNLRNVTHLNGSHLDTFYVKTLYFSRKKIRITALKCFNFPTCFHFLVNSIWDLP